jgi:DNA-binding IclR family transcriptional regulator
MVAGMSISVPSIRWNDERRGAWSALIRDGAAELSHRLGNRPVASSR